jgi:hypothetical protein
LINEAALEFPDIESHELSIDPVSAATLTTSGSTTEEIEEFLPSLSYRDFPAGIRSVPAQPTKTTITLNPATHPHNTDCFVIWLLPSLRINPSLV